jgi:hypothetical protein
MAQWTLRLPDVLAATPLSIQHGRKDEHFTRWSHPDNETRCEFKIEPRMLSPEDYARDEEHPDRPACDSVSPLITPPKKAKPLPQKPQ